MCVVDEPVLEKRPRLVQYSHSSADECTHHCQCAVMVGKQQFDDLQQEYAAIPEEVRAAMNLVDSSHPCGFSDTGMFLTWLRTHKGIEVRCLRSAQAALFPGESPQDRADRIMVLGQIRNSIPDLQFTD